MRCQVGTTALVMLIVFQPMNLGGHLSHQGMMNAADWWLIHPKCNDVTRHFLRVGSTYHHSLHIQGPFKTLTGIFTLNPSVWWMQKRSGSKKNSWSYPRIPSTRINDSRYWLNWTLTSAGAGATGSLRRSKWWHQNDRSGNWATRHPKTGDLEKATQILSIILVV